jgi:ribosome-associated protein
MLSADRRPSMLTVSPQIRIPDDELRFSFVRSSGPGGQNVNKLNTKAQLRWAIRTSPGIPREVRQRFLERYAKRITDRGELVLTSQRFRDQRQNQRDCLEKLRSMLAAVAAPPKPRKKTKPTKSSVLKRRTQKYMHSQKKKARHPKFEE